MGVGAGIPSNRPYHKYKISMWCKYCVRQHVVERVLQENRLTLVGCAVCGNFLKKVTPNEGDVARKIEHYLEVIMRVMW